MTVGEPAEEPRPDRAHQEGHRKDRPHIQGGVLFLGREELGLEVGRKHRVDVDVVPLHQVAGRALEGIGNGAAQAWLSCPPWAMLRGSVRSVRVASVSWALQADVCIRNAARAGGA